MKLVMLDSFDLAFRIMQEYRLNTVEVFQNAVRALGRARQVGKIGDFLKNIKVGLFAQSSKDTRTSTHRTTMRRGALGAGRARCRTTIGTAWWTLSSTCLRATSTTSRSARSSAGEHG